MSRWMRTLVARAMLLLALFLWGCMFAAPIDISGVWSGTITWTSGPMTGLNQPVTLDLAQVNHDVSGTVTLVSYGTNTFDLPVTYGRARNANLDLEAFGQNTTVPSSPDVRFALDADYAESSMSGSGTQSIDGTVYEFDFEATRISGPPEA